MHGKSIVSWLIYNFCMYGHGIVSLLVCMDKVLYPYCYTWTWYCNLVGMYGQGIVSLLVCMDKIFYPSEYGQSML